MRGGGKKHRAAHGTAVAALAALSAGCGLFQRRPPAPPAVVIPQPPILFQAAPPREPPMAPPAEFTPALAMTPDFLLAGMTPARLPAPPKPPPRRTAETGQGERPGNEHAAPPTANAAEAPQLTTNLSPEQQAAYRNNTLAVLDQTERDLKALYERRDLNTTAAATRAQATEYVRQAREALAQGDLVRAQTLANKAETLARFLLGS